MSSPARIITSTLLALVIATSPAMANSTTTTTSTIKSRWVDFTGAIVKFFLVEGAKKVTQVAVGNALNQTAPELKISYHIHNYDCIQTNSIPHHPVSASVFKMMRDGEGKANWTLKSSLDGVMTHDGPVTQGLPGMNYNSWARNCIQVHDNKSYVNHFSERFIVLVQVQVVNYNALPKSARPTSVTIDFNTDAYRLIDPCQPTDLYNPGCPNRQDVKPRAITTIAIGADGYGCNRGTVLSPGGFISYSQFIHTSEITVSTEATAK